MGFKVKKGLFLLLFLLLIPSFLAAKDYQIKVFGIKNITKDIVHSIQEKIHHLESGNIKEKIEEIFLDSGWFSQVNVEEKEKGIYYITVEEYPEIKKITLHGNTLFKDKHIISLLGLEVNQMFNRSRFYAHLNELYHFYRSRGYSQVEVEKVDIQKNGLLKIFIREWKVNEIILPEKTRTKKEVLSQYLIPQKEKIYNSIQLKKWIEELDDTGAYNAINISVEKSQDKGYLNLKAHLDEKRPALNLRLQYNGYKGLNGLVRIKDSNFLGNLDEFSIQDTFYYLGSSSSHQIQTVWNRRIQNKGALSLCFSLGGKYWKNKFFRQPVIHSMDACSWNGSLGIEKIMGTDYRVETGLRMDHWSLNVEDQINLEESFNLKEGLFFVPYFLFEYDKEDPLERKGWNSQVKIDLPIKKENSGLKIIISGSHYFTLFEDSKLFLFAQSGISTSKKLPFVYRFWLGHNDLLPYLQYEEIAFEDYGLMSAKVEFPYLFHFLRISPYLSILTPFKQIQNWGRARVFYGVEMKLSIYGLSVYMSFSFAGHENIKSGIFSIYFK